MHRETPLLNRSLADGRDVWLKMECWQPTGSFKIRGIGHLCQKAQAAGATALVSSSGGNAGMAAAQAGRELGLPVTVVVPSTTPVRTRQRLADLSAKVTVHGDVWDEADQRARELAQASGAAFIPPFDHPDIWTGHATMIEECARQGPRPDAVVLSVGGGGLMCGVLQGMHAAGWSDVPLIAAETAGAASLQAAMQADRLVALPAITSIATTLGARQVAAAALDWTRRHPVSAVQVSDADAVLACRQFADDERVLVEPACGAALAAVQQPEAAGFQRLLVVVCGGSGVTLDQLQQWHDEL